MRPRDAFAFKKLKLSVIVLWCSTMNLTAMMFFLLPQIVMLSIFVFIEYFAADILSHIFQNTVGSSYFTFFIASNIVGKILFIFGLKIYSNNLNFITCKLHHIPDNWMVLVKKGGLGASGVKGLRYS